MCSGVRLIKMYSRAQNGTNIIFAEGFRISGSAILDSKSSVSQKLIPRAVTVCGQVGAS